MASENEALQALVTEAIYKHLDEKKREELIKSAITALLEIKRKSPYEPAKSTLQECFESAVNQVARAVVGEKILKDERIKAEIAKVVNEGFEKVMSGEHRAVLVNGIAKSIAYAFAVTDR